LMIDAIEGVTEQDLKIAAFAHDKGKALVILVNKWDLAREQGVDAQEFELGLRERMQFIAYAPVRFVSAKTGRRVFDVLTTVEEVATHHFSRISTGRLNRVLGAAVNAHPPPVVRGRRVKIYFGTQVRTAPPTFVLATNDPQGVHFSYRRYLINQLRDAFTFHGTPIQLLFRARGSDAGREKNMEARKRAASLRGKDKKRKKAAR